MKTTIKNKEQVQYYVVFGAIFLVFSSWFLGEKVGRLLAHL